MHTDFSMALVHQAMARLQDKVIRTPVLSSPMLDQTLGCRVLLKAESLQRTGAFKFRGALNALLALPPEVRARGIVAFSSGNHGHAVAAAAAQAGCKAIIVLPQAAPQIKVDNCRWWGAQVVQYDPATQSREAIGQELAQAQGMRIVPPFDDYDIMAGQATCGVELSEQLHAAGVTPDAVIVPCSGGGLASGVITAMRDRYADVQALFVEPQGIEKMAATLTVGEPQTRDMHITTLMDGLSGPRAGLLPARVLHACNARGLSVNDADALAAMALAFRTLKLVLEPAGAAALAAVLRHKAQFSGQTVALIGSGGNVDPAVFCRAIQ